MSLLFDLERAVRLDNCPSTQAVARQLAREGAPEGTLVLAASQSAGRGREDRVWHSPRGLGLWMSFLLRPRVEPSDWPALTALTALATAEAVDSLRPVGTPPPRPCAVKWPNDLYGRRGKIGGILAETTGAAVVVGLGLNLAQETVDFPEELRKRASSLRLEGFDPIPTADLAARAVNERLTPAYDSFQNGNRSFLREGLCARFLLKGARVRMAWPGGSAEGTAVDLGPAGELILETMAGRRVLVAGEVVAWERPGN